MIRVILGATGLLLVSRTPAYAYIDPGTASIILQAVVGAVAAAGLFFRSHLGRLLSLLRRRTVRDGSSDSASDDGTPPDSPDGR